MQWFKFYGQDFLTDPKIKSLSVERRQCWVVLLCLANAEEKDGHIRFVKESDIMIQAGIEYDGQTWHETLGFIELFEELQMITIDNENDNVYDVTLLNFTKRQGGAMTNYERLKKWRNKKKTLSSNEAKGGNNDNDDNENDNDRIDKNRKEKNDTKYKKGSVRENITSQTARSLEEKKEKDQKEAEVLTEALYTAKAIKVDYEKLERSDKASFLYVFIKAKTNVEILKNIKQAMLPIAEYGRPISNNARARLLNF